MSEVHDSAELRVGDQVQFVVVQNQRNSRYSACNLRKITWVLHRRTCWASVDGVWWARVSFSPLVSAVHLGCVRRIVCISHLSWPRVSWPCVSWPRVSLVCVSLPCVTAIANVQSAFCRASRASVTTLGHASSSLVSPAAPPSPASCCPAPSSRRPRPTSRPACQPTPRPRTPAPPREKIRPFPPLPPPPLTMLPPPTEAQCSVRSPLFNAHQGRRTFVQT